MVLHHIPDLAARHMAMHLGMGAQQRRELGDAEPLAGEGGAHEGKDARIFFFSKNNILAHPR